MRFRSGDAGPTVGLVILAIVHGLLYAALLPPWDLNDEEQHFDYIVAIAERGTPPRMGDYLSDRVIRSLAETDRWGRFHLGRPDHIVPSEMGLEGYSYEAYQSPGYYALMAVAYRLLPDPTLAKLYGLRACAVALAAASLMLAYWFFRLWLPDNRRLPAVGAVLMALIPERTIATSRVNNDGLLELVAATTLFLLFARRTAAWSLLFGAAIGGLVGLGVLAKASGVVLAVPALVVVVAHSRRTGCVSYALTRGAALGGGMLVTCGWAIWRNVGLYGDPTGSRAFLDLAGFAPAPDWPRLLLVLPQALWMTRWNGPFPTLVGAIVGVAGLAVVTSGVAALHVRRRSPTDCGAALVALAAAVWMLPLLVGLSTGLVRTVEGRLLLPAYAPLTALVLWRLRRFDQSGGRRPPIAALLAAAALTDGAYLAWSLRYYYAPAAATLTALL